MTQDNTKSQFCSARTLSKSGLSSVFVFVLLFYPATYSSAKDGADKSRWAVNSNARLGQKELSEKSPVIETEAEAAPSTTVPSTTVPKPAVEQANLAANSPEPIKSPEESDSLEASRPDEANDALADYDVTEGAAPLDIPDINVSPIVALSPALRDSLERQFQAIQTLKETENAFSERLGESYLAYGRSLTQAGRTDEARSMLVNALHIAKINNGVTSIEQRPILRELFEMNLALGNTEEMTDQVSRVVWLEKKNPDQQDTYSFDMIVRLGNHYLDLYLNNRAISELSLSHLNNSTKYLGYAVNRYGDRPLSELLLPYGELALAHYEQSRIQHEVDRSFYQDTRQRTYNDLNKLKVKHSKLNSYSRSEGFLKDYLRKAKSERDLVNTIQALLGLGDLNLLTGRYMAANKYFDLAWTGAQNLPLAHPIVASFANPVKLPSFNFSVVRRPPTYIRETELVALSINIDDDGRVRRVAREALVDTDKWTTTKARRLVKRYKFRPIIENGKLVASKDYPYEVRVVSRKSKAVASKDSPE
jgi:tetratricopeptide (TPR) repeat protein